MCYLAQVSRASYYRHLEEAAPDEAEMAMRVAIQEVVLAHRRRYGYRRVSEDLHRKGMMVNHKRVLRIMGEDNLLAIRYRKYIMTTDSRHDCEVYLNSLASGYKSHRFSWLENTSDCSWESMSWKACKMGTCSKSVTLSTCRIS